MRANNLFRICANCDPRMKYECASANSYVLNALGILLEFLCGMVIKANRSKTERIKIAEIM